jgi:hypothetical protein
MLADDFRPPSALGRRNSHSSVWPRHVLVSGVYSSCVSLTVDKGCATRCVQHLQTLANVHVVHVNVRSQEVMTSIWYMDIRYDMCIHYICIYIIYMCIHIKLKSYRVKYFEVFFFLLFTSLYFFLFLFSNW